MEINNKDELIKEILILKKLGLTDDDIMERVGCGKAVINDSALYALDGDNLVLKSDLREQELLKDLTMAKHGKPKFEKFYINGKQYVDLVEVIGSSEWDVD